MMRTVFNKLLQHKLSERLWQLQGLQKFKQFKRTLVLRAGFTAILLQVYLRKHVRRHNSKLAKRTLKALSLAVAHRKATERKLQLAVEYLADVKRQILLPKLFVGLRLQCLQQKKMRELDEINDYNASFFQRTHSYARLKFKCLRALRVAAQRAAFEKRSKTKLLGRIFRAIRKVNRVERELNSSKLQLMRLKKTRRQLLSALQVLFVNAC